MWNVKSMLAKHRNESVTSVTCTASNVLLQMTFTDCQMTSGRDGSIIFFRCSLKKVIKLFFFLAIYFVMT